MKEREKGAKEKKERRKRSEQDTVGYSILRRPTCDKVELK